MTCMHMQTHTHHTSRVRVRRRQLPGAKAKIIAHPLHLRSFARPQKYIGVVSSLATSAASVGSSLKRRKATEAFYPAGSVAAAAGPRSIASSSAASFSTPTALHSSGAHAPSLVVSRRAALEGLR